MTELPFNLDRCDALRRVPLAGGPPVYQFSLCDRKRDAQAGRLLFQPVEEILEPSDVATVGEGSYCEGEVVHVRDHQTPRDPEMQWRHVEEKEERGDRRPLGGSDIDWGWGSWRPLENQGAASLAQKGRNPGNQIWGYPAFPQDSGQSFVVDVVEPCFYIQEQGGDLEAGLCRVLMSLVRVRHAS